MNLDPSRFDPKGFEAAAREVLIRLSVLESLTELLIQKGFITREEWNWRASACREDVEKRFASLPLDGVTDRSRTD